MASPMLSSFGMNMLRSFPLKTLCCAALFIPFIPIMIDVHFVTEDSHTPDTMCSLWHPGYATLLDMTVTLPDGSFQSGQWIYPQSAVWNRDGIVRGCPCSIGPCVRPCCPNGQFFSGYNLLNEGIQPNCINVQLGNRRRKNDLVVSSDSNPLQQITVSGSAFPLLEASCIVGLLPFNGSLSDKGNIFVWGKTSLSFQAFKNVFCFQALEKELYDPLVFYCKKHQMKDVEAFMNRKYFTSGAITGVTTVLHLVTLVAFALVPLLRATDHGKSLMGYTLAFFFLKITFLVKAGIGPYYRRHTFVDNLSNSLIKGVVLWQLITTWQMWTTFKPGTVRLPNAGDTQSKFVWYSIVCWGTCALCFVIEYSVPDYKVYFNLYLELALYLATACLNVAALYRLKKCLSDSKKIQGKDSQRHNAKEYNWAAVFLKVSLVTGLDFALGNIVNHVYLSTNGYGVAINSLIRYFNAFHDYLISLKGVEVFFFNVWQKSTWDALHNKYFKK